MFSPWLWRSPLSRFHPRAGSARNLSDPSPLCAGAAVRRRTALEGRIVLEYHRQAASIASWFQASIEFDGFIIMSTDLTHLRRDGRGTALGRAALLGASLAAASGPAFADACASRVEAFNRAVDAAPDQAAQAQIEAIVNDPKCGGYIVPAQRRLAAARLAAAQKLMEAKAPQDSYLSLVVEADRPAVFWQAAATLAELRFSQRQFVDAAHAFDRAIDIVNNDTLTPHDPGPTAIERLLQRAAAARLLAANGEAGKQAFVMTATRDGRIGGIFTPRVRGVVPRSVPVPITFEYRSASLTEQGRAAAAELARAIKEQQPQNVRLVGHTDVRGGPDYNKKLSAERAETVAAFLKENDIEVPVEPVGVGADEPLRLSDESGLTQDDIYALNRRVEWRRE
jgi:outer membrane protein OmpA-like peptidoglycan-associated protein